MRLVARGHGKTRMRLYNCIIEDLRYKGFSDKEIMEILKEGGIDGIIKIRS